MTDSARLALPLLEPGQAQKEVWHNEALAMLDIAVQASMEGIADSPPVSPALGQCWIVGPAPTAAWSGRAGAIAGWTQGGWRFVAPRGGLVVWNAALGTTVRRRGGAWVPDRSAPVAGPAGGTVVDAQARTAIAAILAVLAERGWLA